jgi:hypothetical protein
LLLGLLVLLHLLSLVLPPRRRSLWATFVMEESALITITAGSSGDGPTGLLRAWHRCGLELLQLSLRHLTNLRTAVMWRRVALAVAELAVRAPVITDLVGTPIFEVAVTTAQVACEAPTWA